MRRCIGIFIAGENRKSNSRKGTWGCGGYYVPIWRVPLWTYGVLYVKQRIHMKKFSWWLKVIYSWSSSFTYVERAISTSGISRTVNICSSSGVYTDGVLRWARAVPCSLGRYRTSPAVIEHMVEFRMRPAPESIWVWLSQVLFRRHLTVSFHDSGNVNPHITMPQKCRCIVLEYQFPFAGSAFNCDLKV